MPLAMKNDRLYNTRQKLVFLISNGGGHIVIASIYFAIMNLNKFFQAKSEFSHVVQMVRNHIAKEHFVSNFVL